jgi:16S rRNA (adenine1518-N6/adenine1519-N6)-dimethyltransferase
MKVVRPKKKLGQHFLKDKNLASKIVESLSNNTKNLLEIGAGTGILTDMILQKHIDNFKIVEIDEESVDFLLQKYPQIEEQIISADFLKLDMQEVFKANYSIIGNFPYNISSQILFKVWEERNRVEEVVGMFQKEVAERVASKPGSKVYGILSVLLQSYYNIEYLFSVSENVFNPPPKVKSGVIRLKRKPLRNLGIDESLFKDVVKMAFNQRRKTISNSLKTLGIKEASLMCDTILQKRPEQLSVENFINITRALSS